MFKRILVTTLIIFHCFTANAKAKPVDAIDSRCLRTPSLETFQFTPESYNSTNNLYSITGSFEKASGTKIMIIGRLMDKNCVPISHGVIKLWQTDWMGKISFPTIDHLQQVNGDKNFAGTGVANSDNLGRFVFFTVMPGTSSQYLNALNLLVTSDKKELKTKIFLDNTDARKDPEFIKLSQKDRDLLLLAKYHYDENNIIYFIDLVMDYAQDNKSY